MRDTIRPKKIWLTGNVLTITQHRSGGPKRTISFDFRNDAVYKETDLVMLHNTNLANNYGNLVNRVIVLANNKGVQLDHTDTVQAAFQEKVDKQKAEIEHAYESYNIFEAAQQINVLLTYGNKYIDEEKPWKLEYPEVVLNNLHYLLVVASKLYEPIIPVSSQRALEALRAQQPVILYTKLK